MDPPILRSKSLLDSTHLHSHHAYPATSIAITAGLSIFFNPVNALPILLNIAAIPVTKAGVAKDLIPATKFLKNTHLLLIFFYLFLLNNLMYNILNMV